MGGLAPVVKETSGRAIQRPGSQSPFDLGFGERTLASLRKEVDHPGFGGHSSLHSILPKSLCGSPNAQHFQTWPYLEKGSLQRSRS